MVNHDSDVTLSAGHILSELIDDPLFLIDLIAKSGQLLMMKATGRFTLQADRLLKEKCARCKHSFQSWKHFK